MATAAVGKLWVGLSLKTGGYQAGLKKANGMTKKSAKEMKSTFSSVFSGNFLAGLALKAFSKVTAVIKGWVKKITDEFDNLDALAKFSRQLDINANALIAWRQAAELAGTGADTFDKGLEKLAINLGMAAEKGGPAADVLESLNLNAKALAAGPLDQAFIKISEAISKQDNSIEKAFQTAQLFGKAGPKIALMMAGGAKELEDSMAQVMKDGRGFSKGQLEGIEAANDAMTKLVDQSKVFFQTIAIALAPHMQAAADDLRGAFASAKSDSGSIVAAVDGMASAFKAAIGAAKVVAGIVGAAVFGVGSLILKAVLELETLIDKIPGVTALLGKADTSGIESALAGAEAGFAESVKIMERGASAVGGFFSGDSQKRIDAIREANIANAGNRPIIKLPLLEESQVALNKETMGLMSVAAETISELANPEAMSTPQAAAQAGAFNAAIQGTQEARSAINASMRNPIEAKIEKNTAATADAVDKQAELMEEFLQGAPIPNAQNTVGTATIEV